ncbi:MAG: heterodisulfide reductase subunit A2 [Candidatus Argoarchaeum ethanivorans]|uniref:CoB--CoM heterodisulfide reductase iron-sulfur subunit A n=1 Tax=Candidatus Argoarchaeum ethanivorans TaxID=2608793 RepID=A0A8B3S0M9_9EURY|nr:MAG: heterodisulfide reductase subunit A2 [Candidatus Argoarchaeum ethanivorans]
MSNKNIGVYLCRCGGNISDVVNVEEVVDKISGMSNVTLINIQDYLCSSAGQGQIEDDIKAGKINRVVIGSCSPKLHLETFRAMAQKAGINPILLEIVNIREQCSWVHEDREEATRKATGLITGAVLRMQRLESLKPLTKNLQNRALVVGGGITGITTALELADERDVILIEKEPYIGGHMIGLSKTFPTLDCSQCILTPKMVAIFNHPNITLYTQTEVASVEGNVGDFEVTLRRMPRYVDIDTCTACGRCEEKCSRDAISLPFAQAIPQAYIIDKDKCNECGACVKVCAPAAIKLDDATKETKINVGAIAITTGFESIDPSIIEEYNYWHPDVITAIEFEEMLSAKSKTGMRLQKSDGTMPQKVAFVLCVGSRDFNRGNKYCSKVCCLYSQKQAQLVLKMNPGADVTLFYIDMRAAGRRMEEFYHHTQELGINFVRGRVADITPLDDGKLQARYEDTFLGEIGRDEFDMIVLCPSLTPSKGLQELADQLHVAVGADGFIEEKHVKLDPVNTLNQGVFVAGCAVGPKDIHDSVTEGIGAAHKISSFLGKGVISISPEKPVIMDTCDCCGICVEECPYDALTIADGKPVLDPLSCNLCGICVATCPQKAVEIANYRRDQLKAQAEGVLSAGMGVIVYIDPEAYAAADLAGMDRSPYSPLIRFIQVPSIHMLDADIINHAYECGAGGVMLIEGTTDEVLTKRSKSLYSQLKKETKAHKKPIRYSHIETAQYEKLMNLLNVFAEQVEARAAKEKKKKQN